MRVRTLLAAFFLAATAALGCAAASAAHDGPGPDAVNGIPVSPILGIPVGLYCHTNTVLGNAPSCEE
ncbi:hypothetical protein [Streptomyces echinatus]|uniref:Chaplin n=1 Tax=Streptomyces echinatus TaxID=67293 RepID=A0A7W9UPM4_9ACTN|nr:hypothetical protein [Streptomyces echinatus]MBB5926505.1 hypothetical protein [Streptomyces echinatus]